MLLKLFASMVLLGLAGCAEQMQIRLDDGTRVERRSDGSCSFALPRVAGDERASARLYGSWSLRVWEGARPTLAVSTGTVNWLLTDDLRLSIVGTNGPFAAQPNFEPEYEYERQAYLCRDPFISEESYEFWYRTASGAESVCHRMVPKAVGVDRRNAHFVLSRRQADALADAAGRSERSPAVLRVAGANVDLRFALEPEAVDFLRDQSAACRKLSQKPPH